MNQPEQMRPPWTVKALVAWGIAGAAWGLIFGAGWDGSDLLRVGLVLLFTWAMWTAQRWVFSLSFAGAVLCGLILVGVIVSGSTLVDTTTKIVSAVSIAGNIYLLRHRLTKRFLGIGTEPSFPEGPPDRGGRVAQAIAVSLFGILAIGVPILWAFGRLEGSLLLVAALACLGSGIAVLVLGLPARSAESPVSPN